MLYGQCEGLHCARLPTSSVGTLRRVRRRFDPFVQHRGCLLLKRASLDSRSLLLDFCAMRHIVSRRGKAGVVLRVISLLSFATCRAAALAPRSADRFASINITSRASAYCVEISDAQAMLAMTSESAPSATAVSPLRPRRNAAARPAHFEPATCRPTEPPFQAERDGEGAMAEGLQKRWQGEPKDAPQCKCC